MAQKEEGQVLEFKDIKVLRHRKIVKLLVEGYSLREIAKKVKCDKMTVSNVKKKYEAVIELEREAYEEERIAVRRRFIEEHESDYIKVARETMAMLKEEAASMLKQPDAFEIDEQITKKGSTALGQTEVKIKRRRNRSFDKLMRLADLIERPFLALDKAQNNAPKDGPNEPEDDDESAFEDEE